MQESPDASLVRIRTVDGRVVGAGFLVGERQILTCAHVVSQALGLPGNPLDPLQGAVLLDFPLIAPRTPLTASVAQWCPLLADGRGDIAGLELQGEPPVGVEVVRFALAEDLWEHAFRAFGFPAGYDDGVWSTGRLLGRQATDWVMIEDVKAQGFAVGPGFSGTPVWDRQLQGVVGMVVTASRPADTKAAFVLPLDVLVAAWPLIEPITRQRVFLSAAPADDEFADRLRIDLEARGIMVWTEQHTPDDGQTDKEERIRQAIRAAQAVMLVVSSQTRSSRTVKEHLRLADLYSRRLILVWVGDEPAQPQRYSWRETTLIDVHKAPYEAALEAIEATLSQRRSISALLGPSHVAVEEEQKEPRNPYKGLRAFTADDAGDFFGRDRLVDELVQDVTRMMAAAQPASNGGRLLTIIGPSGSGKSSVMMAGLLPKLRKGGLPGSEAWVYLEPVVPGRHPIEALGLKLKPHFPDTSFKTLREDLEDDASRGLHQLATQLARQQGSKVVLLVDQFEELFTQTESEDERQRFIDLLLAAVTEPRGPLLVLLTLRADFYDRLLHYPELYHLIQVHQKPLLPMEVDDLRAVIEQPAALPDVQLTFEGNLVGDVLFEMRGQVGTLPLLQFTLEQLFERRSGHRLTLSAYREIGGVKGALSQHAEHTYAALPSEEHRRLARVLFVRLIDPGVTEQDTTRRRAALSEFTLDDAAQTQLLRETIDTFIAARLLTTNEVAGTTTIEVSHEAVIREWKRLAEWMREARQDILLQQMISEDVAEWERHRKSRDRLYRGSQLKDAQAWARRNLPSSHESAFLRASAKQRMLYLVSVTVILLLLVSTTGLLVRPFIQSSVMALIVAIARANVSTQVQVTNLNDNGPGSLRQAITAAAPGSTITFHPGLKGIISLSSDDLIIAKNLVILGPGPHLLSITGGHNSHQIHVITGVSITISGLTIASFDSSGIKNFGMLTLINSIVSHNKTDGDGGGIENFATGTLTLKNSIVSDNTAASGNPTFIGNPVFEDGGGIYNHGRLMLINSVVSGNTAAKYGGGIVNGRGTATATIINSVVSDNTACTGGGGIYNGAHDGAVTLTLTDSTITGNSVGHCLRAASIPAKDTAPGGGIYNTSLALKLMITNSTISSNMASHGPGGGIYNQGPLTLTNSTISGNMSSFAGGGIAISNGQVTLTFCTIYANMATQTGGGILIQMGGDITAVQMNMQNSIVAGNHAGTSPDVSGTLTTYGYNLIQNISGATFEDPLNEHSTDIPGDIFSDLGIDPLLRDNGGPTPTHALFPGSPAINQVPRSACLVNGVTTDQRGMRRPDSDEDACDMGAYELQDST